ncbi:MAG TPA: S1 RNA-binding domain-containing protein [Aggregatilinea sp.]|jgi:ribosomal protein S1|uniref:S1 RNA-binding domain-containing protein n=1 Tax=Aggregatilinea sp. TaxID=2806333 RepID=UPI002CAEFE23|nr:S1 RNA-binding domain-containing protein [Aggregatilinea sp.]HML22774.1 S1 RNA-binding domain-containing protein [Aggregatilinea sp.]
MTTENIAPTTIDEVVPKMKVEGVVKKIELYGALVDIGVGRPGLLHISQISEGHVKNVSDVLQEGQTITAWVQEVDRKRGRISLTMLEPAALGWSEIDNGKVFTGKVVRVEKFGAFVDIGAERPGLVHVSELAQGYVGDPTDVVKVGDEVQVKVIGVNRRKKQIDMSIRALEEAAMIEAIEEDDEDMPTAMELALRQALEGSGMVMPQRQQQKKRGKKEKRHQEREDIFARTLRQHAND